MWGIFDLAQNLLTWTGIPGMGAGAVFAINGGAREDEEAATAKRRALDAMVDIASKDVPTELGRASFASGLEGGTLHERWLVASEEGPE